MFKYFNNLIASLLTFPFPTKTFFPFGLTIAINRRGY